MHARCCPACSKRYAQLISSNCPVCEGAGYVVLGAAALSLYEPATVSRAVSLAVEAEARQIEAETTLSDDRAGKLRASLRVLVNAGLIAEPKTPRRVKATRHLRAVPDLPAAAPADVAASYADVEPIDEALIDAEPYEYQIGERPNVRGLPTLSAAGHPSSTARLADPMPVGTDTGAVARQRGEQGRAALVLVKAAPVAANIKARRAAREGKAA